MKFKLIIAALAAVSLSACSTIVNGSNQLVKVNTGEVEGANCTATGGSDFAVNESFTTPAEIKFPRSKKALKFECSKAGFQTANKTVTGKVEGSTAGNVLLGGGIGVGVDALTGAIYKYPGTVFIEMLEIGATATKTIEEPIAK